MSGSVAAKNTGTVAPVACFSLIEHEPAGGENTGVRLALVTVIVTENVALFRAGSAAVNATHNDRGEN